MSSRCRHCSPLNINIFSFDVRSIIKFFDRCTSPKRRVIVEAPRRQCLRASTCTAGDLLGLVVVARG